MTKKEFKTIVDKQENGCWIWKGLYNRGRARCKEKDEVTGNAAKLVCNLYGKAIPVGMYTLHRCDNPGCVRPAHIFPGTQADNMADMISKGRKAVLGEKARARIAAATSRSHQSGIMRYNTLPARKALLVAYAKNDFREEQGRKIAAGHVKRREKGLPIGAQSRMINFKNPWLIRILYTKTYEIIFDTGKVN